MLHRCPRLEPVLEAPGPGAAPAHRPTVEDENLEPAPDRPFRDKNSDFRARLAVSAYFLPDPGLKHAESHEARRKPTLSRLSGYSRRRRQTVGDLIER